MSRIGKKPIQIPDKVQVKIEDRLLTAKGPKGELSFRLPEGIDYSLENNTLTFSRQNDLKHIRALHGLTRAEVYNRIVGVSEGFTRTLLIEGVGYKVEMRGKNLLLSMGYSHPILFIPPDNVTIEAPNPTTIKISSIDKNTLGLVAAKIRSIRPPEPYKGKGIRYEGEYIRRKAGKASAK
ncbi:MAG TPA: 50S ribosomal protein L6 [Candidatus Kapabacteria bacterium]|nr:50S ribosomal protein L6 [Candidatus Kapabacteria bacterium]